MERIFVPLKSNAYPIHVGSGSLPRLGKLLREFPLSSKAFLISDPQVGGLYGEEAIEALRESGFSPVLVQVPQGEGYKSLSWAARLYDRLLRERADRRSPIVALGGGVVGDLAGFVAATYLRGIPFIQVPTSLLAQIDSSVGGKVAVNRGRAKNMVGAFYQPLMVLIDTRCLQTLPQRELRAGMAEVIKYGIIRDPSFFSFLERNLGGIFALNPETLATVIRRCCEIKASIVAQDEKEEGVRAILNYGHTIGHALEAATQFRLFRHGEAVAVGMEAAGRIGGLLGLGQREAYERQRSLLGAAGLALEIPLPPQKLVKWLYYDKKAREGRIHFVLTRAIGDVIIRPLAEESLILKALEGMVAGSGR